MLSRRSFMFMTLTAALSGCCPRPGGVFDDISLALQGFHGFDYGAVVRRLGTADRIAINPNVPLAAASINKILIAISIVRRSTAALNQYVHIDSQAFAASSAYIDRKSRAVSLYDLLRLMIVQSDNVAANALLLHVGRNEIRDTKLALGLSSTDIHDLFEDRSASKSYGTTCAKDVDMMLSWIETASKTPQASMQQQKALQLLTLMTEQADRRLLEAGLPRALVVANKTGQVDGVLNDSSIIDPFSVQPVYASFLCSNVNDVGRALRVFRNIGYALFNYLYPTLVHAQ